MFCSAGVYEVGVHIADVGYFIDPGSTLDREASRRATSVYFVQKVCHGSPYNLWKHILMQVIPMLPRVLCEHLCSLNPGEVYINIKLMWHNYAEHVFINIVG